MEFKTRSKNGMVPRNSPQIPRMLKNHRDTSNKSSADNRFEYRGPFSDCLHSKVVVSSPGKVEIDIQFWNLVVKSMDFDIQQWMLAVSSRALDTEFLEAVFHILHIS